MFYLLLLVVAGQSGSMTEGMSVGASDDEGWDDGSSSITSSSAGDMDTNFISSGEGMEKVNGLSQELDMQNGASKNRAVRISYCSIFRF